MRKPLRSEQFLLNLLGQKISIFPIADNEVIEKGGLVVVNTRTLQASAPKKESGYHAAGRAVRIVMSEEGTKMVICKDGIYFADNTDSPEHKILDTDIGRACYFNDSSSVTLDNINTTKAGEVLSVNDDNRVLIKISIDEGGDMKW